jgi:hypothetical protein
VEEGAWTSVVRVVGAIGVLAREDQKQGLMCGRGVEEGAEEKGQLQLADDDFEGEARRRTPATASKSEHKHAETRASSFP